jgi:hypothetical protein
VCFTDKQQLFSFDITIYIFRNAFPVARDMSSARKYWNTSLNKKQLQSLNEYLCENNMCIEERRNCVDSILRVVFASISARLDACNWDNPSYTSVMRAVTIAGAPSPVLIVCRSSRIPDHMFTMQFPIAQSVSMTNFETQFVCTHVPLDITSAEALKF